MVSVLIPAYNAEKTIHRCLDSVLAQTYCDIEVIIVNDGSKDSTLAELHMYEKKDERVKVIDQPNCGVAATRNVALDNAIGDYILYVDADDWIEPNMLESLLKLADDADIVFCGNDNANTTNEVKQIDNAEIDIWDNARQLLEFVKHKQMNGMLWNKLIRRSITEGCRFNEKTGYGEDAEFLWQVLKKSEKMVVTNEILYHHTLEETSISHLSFSEKKYSAIPMWERINAEVATDYPQLIVFAKNSLTCAAVFSMFEARKCGYQNKEHIKHMRSIARKNIFLFLRANYISLKFKLYALAVCAGY